MCGGMQRCTDGCTEGLVKVYKGTQGAQRYAGSTEVCRVHRGAYRNVWRCMEVYRDCTKVGKGTQHLVF